MHNKTRFAEEIAEFLELPKGQLKELDMEEEEQLYTTGYHLYENGDYLNAALLFTKLVLSDPFTVKYWRGLASSRQMQKEYLAATRAWSLVALIEEKDPMPHFHAAECLFSLNEKQDALKALQAAESLITGSETALCDKITLLKKVHFNE